MHPSSDNTPTFGLSLVELERRERAFDRLGLSTLATYALFTALLSPLHLVEWLVSIAALAILFIASRRWLSAANRRYGETRWHFESDKLHRTDARSDHEYRLESVRRIQAKRTTAGAIREMKLTLDDGSAVYINGLEDAESFWSTLTSSAGEAAQVVIREPLDYDHYSFYLALGVVLGAAIGVFATIAISANELEWRWVYLAVSTYCILFGAYWARAKPISGRYGVQAARWDHALAGVAVFVAVCFVAAAVVM